MRMYAPIAVGDTAVSERSRIRLKGGQAKINNNILILGLRLHAVLNEFSNGVNEIFGILAHSASF